MGNCTPMQSPDMHWEGTYTQLQDKQFVVRAMHRPPCCKPQCECFGIGTCIRESRGPFQEMLSEKKYSLRKIANGSVAQSVPVSRAELGVGLVVVGKLRFNIFFEEVFDFELQFVEWCARDIFAADDGGTSDPQIEFSIQADVWKWKQGGMYGRSTRSETEFSTLFPKFPELAAPLYYNGTWSELQSEMLQIKLFHQPLIFGETCIGWSSMPLNGMIRIDGNSAEGNIKCGLAVTYSAREEVYEGQFETIQKIEAQGEARGMVLIEQLPKYRQFGAPLRLKPGIQYMAVEVRSCANLPATDENGMTDCFVKAEWENMSQQTKAATPYTHMYHMYHIYHVYHAYDPTSVAPSYTVTHTHLSL